MRSAIIASLPVESRLVPGCFESILDAKVQGAAMNFLQRLIDQFLTWLYCPYHSLYLAKMARVHLLSDGKVRLYDATKQAVGGVDSNFITIRGTRVFFNANPHIWTVFSRQAFTDYIVVQDDEKRRPGWFQIIEQEISRPGNPKPMEKLWTVDTNRFGAVLGHADVYLVEQPTL